uniref:Uncharacterized protein n=1 Tax=Mycena chlorophos TaxID=658473 RepID=A0ABQ0L481_MYCCL|nr:predicted protein [Mycena chlorophos]
MEAEQPLSREKQQDDAETLRKRITQLQTELSAAQTAASEARHELEQTEHARHAARNLASYGHSENIIFVHERETDQGLIYRLSRGDGATASACRFVIRYNIDQFLQRPRVHQWIQNGKLYREATELQSSRFELFFDLLFVGMVHQLSEAAAEEPTGLGLGNYMITFAPAYSIWSDIRDMANQFANDDVTQRAYILWTMILLVGYSNNASSIQVRREEVGEVASFAANIHSVNWAIGFFVVAKVSRALLSLVYAVFLPYSRRPLLWAMFNPLVMALLFFIGIFTPIHVTIVLAVVAIFGDFSFRFFGMVLFKTFEALGKRYERIRSQRLGVSADLEDPDALEGLRSMNSSTTAVDEQPPMSMGDIKMCRKLAARRSIRMPATNIEHLIERLGAFVTIVLGEMVVGVFFASSNAVGLNRESGRAILSLMIAFNLSWLYFDSAVTKHFVHAIRRHWVSGFFFTLLHLPLCMALLLASAAVNALVTTAHVDAPGLKWFFGAGLGVSLCIMATIGALHRNLDNREGITENAGEGGSGNLPSTDKPDSESESGLKRHRHRRTPLPRTTISRRIVIGFRYAAGIAMCLVPLARDLSSMKFLGVYVGITGFLILEETVARIERREAALDVVDDEPEDGTRTAREEE